MNGGGVAAAEERLSRVELRQHADSAAVAETRAEFREFREEVRQWHRDVSGEIARLGEAVAGVASTLDRIAKALEAQGIL